MEIVTLGFPIYQIYKHKRAVRETQNALAGFDQKRLQSYTDSTTTDSILERSSSSKRGNKMYSTESLDECLANSPDKLQVYASCMELNGENIIFLTRVLSFYSSCTQALHETCKSSSDFRKARMAMFRIGLSIFVSIAHSRTASYPINIESSIYNRLDSIFGPATAIIAGEKRGRSPSIATPISPSVTPWDEQDNQAHLAAPGDEISYPMQVMGGTSPPRKKSVLHKQNQWAVWILDGRIQIMKVEKVLWGLERARLLM